MNKATKGAHEQIAHDLRQVGLYLAEHADGFTGHDDELIVEGSFKVEVLLEWERPPRIRTGREIFVL